MNDSRHVMEHKSILELLDRIRMNKETWNLDLGSEGGTEIEYDCNKNFCVSGKVENMSENHLDTDIICKMVY